MSTIDHLPIVKKLLVNRGNYEDDPQAFAIYYYKNIFNGKSFKVCYSENDERNFLHEGEYKGIPTCMFRNGNLTRVGSSWLNSQTETN